MCGEGSDRACIYLLKNRQIKKKSLLIPKLRGLASYLILSQKCVELHDKLKMRGIKNCVDLELDLSRSPVRMGLTALAAASVLAACQCGYQVAIKSRVLDPAGSLYY
jgi:hypothetical protein